MTCEKLNEERKEGRKEGRKLATQQVKHMLNLYLFGAQ
jgi:hypothetical protein